MSGNNAVCDEVDVHVYVETSWMYWVNHRINEWWYSDYSLILQLQNVAGFSINLAEASIDLHKVRYIMQVQN
jgi:hypothetical protein